MIDKSQHRKSANLVDQNQKDLPDKSKIHPSLDISPQKTNIQYPDAQCMVYLATFTPKTTQM